MAGVTDRWMASSRRHLEGELRPGIFAHLVAEKLWREAFAHLEARCFPSSAQLRLPAPAGGEPTLASELEPGAGQTFKHHLVMTETPAPPSSATDVIGIYRGHHAPGGVYWMFTSAMDPDFQRRGAYSAILSSVVAYANEAGVSAVLSQHRADNNAVLIAKLKAGFLISGFRVSGPGLMVELALPLRPGLERAHRFRVCAESELAQMLQMGMLEIEGV